MKTSFKYIKMLIITAVCFVLLLIIPLSVKLIFFPVRQMSVDVSVDAYMNKIFLQTNYDAKSPKQLKDTVINLNRSYYTENLGMTAQEFNSFATNSRNYSWLSVTFVVSNETEDKLNNIKIQLCKGVDGVWVDAFSLRPVGHDDVIKPAFVYKNKQYKGVFDILVSTEANDIENIKSIIKNSDMVMTYEVGKERKNYFEQSINFLYSKQIHFRGDS